MRILFLSGWFPYPPVNGARIRIYNLLKELSAHHEITLLSLVEGMGAPDAEAYLPALGKYCERVETVRAKEFAPNSLKAHLGFLSLKPRSVVDTYSPRMGELVERELARGAYDVLIASEVGAGGRVTPYVNKARQVTKILDALEIGVIREQTSHPASVLKQARYSLTWLKFTRYLRKTLRAFDACTVPSHQEKLNLLQAVPEHGVVRVIPHGLDMTLYQQSLAPPKPGSLVFCGSLTFPPNLDALRFFLGDVYPLIKREIPDVGLQIVGSVEGIPVDHLPTDSSVFFTGLVLDVRPHVAQGWVSVVPLRIGAGTRLKIVEAMALGSPVVSTSKGAEGLEVVHGHNILIADDPADFARQTVRLLRSPELRAQLAANGRRLVEQKYSAETMGRKMNDLLEEVRSRDRR